MHNHHLLTTKLAIAQGWVKLPSPCSKKDKEWLVLPYTYFQTTQIDKIVCGRNK